MNYTFKQYENFNDFLEIRDFLIELYKETQIGTWTIDRLNFTYSVSRIFNGNSIEDWASKIGIWKKNNKIAALVISEGENRGEAFILYKSTPEDSLLKDIFSFIDNNMSITKDNKKEIILTPIFDSTELEFFIKKYGYQSIDWYEKDSYISLENSFDYNLPEGFRIISGSEIKPKSKGYAHAKSFGYIDSEDFNIDIVEKAFDEMTKTPDYKPSLDLCLINNDNEIVSFCTVWYDEKNKLGILEPVGTVKEYQKNGYGKAVIYEGLRRVRKMGAKQCRVGADFDFYLKIGFELRSKQQVYKKVF